MTRKAPTNATELFGDAYADGPSRARPSSSSSTVRSFGPFTAWDADELGKTIDIRIIDDALAADVNDALVALALDERAHARGMCVSNLGGGFHSTPDVFERRKCAATEALRMKVEEALREATASTSAKRRAGRGDGNVVSTSWVNVCDSASAQGHGLHNHANAVWSGVYYASTSDDRADEADEAAGDDKPGDLLIRITAGGVNPLAKKNEKSGYCQYYRVVPKTSRLVIFPSWVLHGVLANGVGDVDAAPRVSFAFNSGETDVTFG